MLLHTDTAVRTPETFPFFLTPEVLGNDPSSGNFSLRVASLKMVAPTLLF